MPPSETPTPTPTETSATSAVTDAEKLLAYRVAARSRATEESIVRLVNKGEVSFAIWGPGEEIHGAATALALSRVGTPENFGFVPHYRSSCLCALWCELNGYDGFLTDVLRQQFSRDTDRISRGRQMVYHLNMPEMGILPVQSPVGMQLSKAAGYAKGWKVKGKTDGFTLAVIGDGSTAEGDMHDAMTAASVWSLPTIILVTDNDVAISTTPDEGRGIKNFKSFAEGYGIRHFSCDGRDFDDTFQTTLAAATYCRDEQKPALIHAHDLPRFNGHSSAADTTFDLTQDDPLIAFGESLVKAGIATADDVLRRTPGEGRDFFAHHELGSIMQEEAETVRTVINQVRSEPEPPPESIFENIRAPFPDVTEEMGTGTTNITYAGAIRGAINNIISRHDGVLWGQDVGRLGGVMTATAGLQALHPERVIDGPLNEPLIVGTACGAGLHDDLLVLPEIQFGDYSLNTLHWLVHMGNLYWATNGKSNFATILRTPVDPFGGGAMYHSMSIDGYFSGIPGLVIIMPSTSLDVYGLLMTAAEYRGPVLCLEPKSMYRQALGPAFPGEPTEAADIKALKMKIMRGEVPTLDPELRIPFQSAVHRREGDDITIVAWGRAVWTALRAAEELGKDGVECDVIDLRTIVPPDLETIFESIGRTGRLIVASEDRSFAGFVRSIQGACVERFTGLISRALGQKNVPGVGQSHVLEEATILQSDHITAAAREILNMPETGSWGFTWMPRRYTNG